MSLRALSYLVVLTLAVGLAWHARADEELCEELEILLEECVDTLGWDSPICVGLAEAVEDCWASLEDDPWEDPDDEWEEWAEECEALEEEAWICEEELGEEHPECQALWDAAEECWEELEDEWGDEDDWGDDDDGDEDDWGDDDDPDGDDEGGDDDHDVGDDDGDDDWGDDDWGDDDGGDDDDAGVEDGEDDFAVAVMGCSVGRTSSVPTAALAVLALLGLLRRRG